MNLRYEGTCPKHGKWVLRWQNECGKCWDKEYGPQLDIPESTMMTDEERADDDREPFRNRREELAWNNGYAAGLAATQPDKGA